jgi:ring-1,2-phenylacetyl-CoA epoxidase subunit PaaC
MTGAYDSLAEEHEGDARWAYGSGFTDRGVPIDAAAPAGVDPADLAAYCLMLGDDALVYSQRLTEWISNAPELEEDVALANIALDLLGQARILLARAGHVEGAGRDEDRLAYLRDAAEFRNVTLAELDSRVDGQLDFAVTIAGLLVFSAWRLALLHRLRGSRDPVLAALAAKAVKELAYHRDYAARWTLRLGDGTATSHARMQAGLDRTWPHLAELFAASEVERRLAAAGVAADPTTTRDEVDAVLDEVLARATLHRPDGGTAQGAGRGAGREGVHTAAFGELLAELQGLARAHPGAGW